MHLLSCEHITMQYDGRNVVNDISFFLDPGDYLCIVGENGSGKSTLMRGLLGLKPLAGGSVIFSGMDSAGKRSAICPSKPLYSGNSPPAWRRWCAPDC